MKTNILKLLKDTGRNLYVTDEVAKSAPVNEGKLEFFKPGRYVTNEELSKEYSDRGLEPASITALCLYDKKNQDKLDEMKYVGTHWKDTNGNWCSATFHRWDDERVVSVYRDDDDWDYDWWFAGLRKSELGAESLSPSSNTLSLELRIQKLEETIEKLTKVINLN